MALWEKIIGFVRGVMGSHPLGAVIAALLPIFGAFLLIACFAYLGAHALGEEYSDVRSYDELFVNQQVRRIKEGARGDIVIFGDSSGLMGIDPLVLEKQLGRTVQNFCTLAYAGPEAYGIMLEEYLARNPAPELLLFAFHPAQLPRSKGWEGWPKLVRKAFKEQEKPASSWQGKIKNFFDSAIYDKLLYIPLSGNYGSYYGSQKSVETLLKFTHGSLLDPGVLFFREVKAKSAPAEIKRRTEDYDRSLKKLKAVLDTSRLKGIALVRTPLPDHLLYDTTGIASDYEEIGETLGINSADRLLDGLSVLPAKYFSSHTHLNRHGKAHFSRLLAERLKPLLRDN